MTKNGPVAQLDRATDFKLTQKRVKIRSLYRETKLIKWMSPYRGNLTSIWNWQSRGNFKFSL